MGRTYYERPKRIDKLSKEDKIDLVFDLINSFGKIRNPIESAEFLEDLLTANEIKNLSIRLRIAKLLLSGKTQREISQNLHTSLATVSKVSIWLNKGGQGFKKVISKLPLRWKKPTRLPRGPIEFHLPELVLASTEYIIASKQEKMAKGFLEKIDEKGDIDRELREKNFEYYSVRKRKHAKP